VGGSWTFRECYGYGSVAVAVRAVQAGRPGRQPSEEQVPAASAKQPIEDEPTKDDVDIMD
jgi:hypothetical protein